jgi:hypothetical protein
VIALRTSTPDIVREGRVGIKGKFIVLVSTASMELNRFCLSKMMIRSQIPNTAKMSKPTRKTKTLRQIDLQKGQVYR